MDISGNGIALVRAIRRARGRYLLLGESEAQIAARWWKFRAHNTHKQRYLWLVIYAETMC
jgi:hypothetical protein